MKAGNGQRGMTLVEVLVSLAVTSIILVGIGSVLSGISDRYQRWADRLNRGATGTQLAQSIQADSHRLVVCHVTSVHTSRLDLCQPDDLGSPQVSYVVSGSGPWVIIRSENGQTSFMARTQAGTSGPPEFGADCSPAAGALSGHIHVYRLRADDGTGGEGPSANTENFSVYYLAPWMSSCP